MPIRLNQLEEKLEGAYGKRKWKPHGTGMDVLISTILSQNTSDINSSRAFESLLKDFSNWEEIAQARISAIAESIKSGGLAGIKAAYIKGALKTIHKDFGNYSLESLKKEPIEKSMEYLTSLRGVGEKTAACVLLFAFGKRIMPVDTHVHRVTVRLGLVPEKSGRQKSFQFWFGKKPVVDYYNLHLNLVKHGRVTCLASRPRCRHCVLNGQCKYFREHYRNN